ncbi:MAG: hypothetical protein M1826_004015 [Phylliscum demangeonii]|nr:MAG: hypothetical protein M1826_004015 [Phylliscum demangeonii]
MSLDHWPDALDHALYCALCGSPLSFDAFAGATLDQFQGQWLNENGDIISDTSKTGTPTGMEWLDIFSLMSPAHSSLDKFKRSPSDLLNGVYIYSDRRSGIGFGPCVVEVYEHDPQTGFACLPMHTACLAIAERVFVGREGPWPESASGGEKVLKPTWLEGFYDRVNQQSRNRERPDEFACAVRWPHGCYGAEAYQGEVWTWMPDDGNKWLCAEPIDVPDLTTFVLAQLQPVSEKEADDGAATASHQAAPSPPPSPLERLPIELLEHIMSYLSVVDILALSRTSTCLHRRMLTQRWWRNALVAGDAVGYLWDLDPTQCRAKDAFTVDKPWDWAALARRFAARDCFDVDAHAGFHEAPGGLRNRQRIWKIVLDV